MRWGEPTRLPPLRRGRGLTAAALLTVGLVAAYVVLGVLSLTSVAPSTLLKGLPKTVAGVLRPDPVPARHTPQLEDFLNVTSPSSVSLADGILFGRVAPGDGRTAHIENTSATALDISVRVIGSTGVSATFAAIALTRYSNVWPSVPVWSTNPVAPAEPATGCHGPPALRRSTA
jgi:hypothetical protein